MNKPNIGRGQNMSIAKAALIYYHERYDWYKKDGYEATLNYGRLQAMHDIVTIAGAEQCSFFTPAQVSSRLSQSPYWDKMFIKGFYSGMRGHGGANIYTVSEKGKRYYEDFLK